VSAFVTPGSTHGDEDATMMLMCVDRCEICVATRGEKRRGDPRILHGCVGAVCEGQCLWLGGTGGTDWGQTQLNPFHRAQRVIRSVIFDGRVRASAKKHL